MCACFLTLLHLYFHFLFSTTKTDTISCNSDSACKSQTKYCTEGEHCYIECKGSSACNSATFLCRIPVNDVTSNLVIAVYSFKHVAFNFVVPQ
eukprot:1050846_1